MIMKTKLIPLLLFGFLVSYKGSCQVSARSSHPKLDSFYSLKEETSGQKNGSKNKVISQDNISTGDQLIAGTPARGTNAKAKNKPAHSTHHHTMYRDTRLGSSSKLYDTYKKNDYGAGAITTNPNK
jgi:hypothetical protein